MEIRNNVPYTKKEEKEQIRAAIRDSIFTEAEQRIFRHELKTWDEVVKFLRSRKIYIRKLSKDEKVKKDNLKNCLNVIKTSQQNDPSKKNVGVSPKKLNDQQSKEKKSGTNPALTKEELEEIEEKAKKENENLVKQGFTKEEVETITKNRIEELKNEKLKNLEQLKNIPDGYKLRNVKGDGNCFYRSVAHIVSGNENNYLSIRNSAAKIASDLKEKVKGLKATYGIDDNRKLEDLDEGVLNDALGNIPFMNIIRQGFGYAKNGNIETIGDALYVLERIRKSLSTDRKEGGEAELYFISVAIGKPVLIYDNNGNVTGYSPTLSPVLGRFLGQEDISMLGNDKVMVYREGVGDNGHYQALVKK